MRGWIVGIPLGALALAMLGYNLDAASSVAADQAARAAPVHQALAGRTFLSAQEAAAAVQAGLVPAGTKSLLDTKYRLRHGEYDWNDTNIPAGKLRVWVDLRRQMISVFRGGHEIGTAVIVYGAEGMQSPLGTFKILNKDADYHSRSYDAPMPYSMFITNTGIALHGSPMSSRRATHGCIGLPVEFAKLLFAAAQRGDTVEVVRTDPRSVAAAESRRFS
ncbi:L,D-transpeptidase [Sphingopyxis sp. P1IMeth2]|uniref:L,D-transpeptidase n=1 Tax=Sphingopyxis sp. P1IMeth2 TaxID=1892848 RepID=UPI0021B20C14|nr:L,D-transpeptidase family protein [Sphingopyxis sp. P1IMeth2]